MAITRRAANRHTVVTQGFTNPFFAWDYVGDNVYATLQSGKSTTRNGDFGFPNITAVGIPVWSRNGYNALHDVYSNGSGYMVTGPNGECLQMSGSSPTGTWQQPTLGGTDTARRVQYGGGYWVIIAMYGHFWWKNNADPTVGSWTYQDGSASDPDLTEQIQCLIYNGSYFVAVGLGGSIEYTNNPSQTWPAWTNNSQGATTFRSIWYNGSYMVAVGDSGTLYYKSGTDPSGSWTQNNQGSTTFWGVTYGGGYWVAVGDSGTLYYKSGTDPSGSWTQNNQGSSTLYSVAYNGTQWLAGGRIRKLGADPSGTWTADTDVPNFQKIHWDGSYWLAVDDTGATGFNYYSGDVDIDEPGIPDGSTINSVKVKVEWGLTALVTGGEAGLQPRVNNANQGTETIKTTTTEEAAEATFSATPSLSDLRSAQTSDLIEARIRVTKGSTSTQMFLNLDYCYLEVDFTAPATYSPPPNAIARKDRRIVTLI